MEVIAKYETSKTKLCAYFMGYAGSANQPE